MYKDNVFIPRFSKIIKAENMGSKFVNAILSKY